MNLKCFHPPTAQATAPAGRSGRVPPESRLLQTSVSSAVSQSNQLESTFRAKPVENNKPTLPNVPANLQDSIRENQEVGCWRVDRPKWFVRSSMLQLSWDRIPFESFFIHTNHCDTLTLPFSSSDC